MPRQSVIGSLAGDSDVATIDELTGDDFSSATDDRPDESLAQPHSAD